MSRRARAAISKARGAQDLWLSLISVWELAKKVEKQPLVLDRPVDRWLDEAMTIPGLGIWELTRPILVDSGELPQPFHGDPTDQIFVATARPAEARSGRRRSAEAGFWAKSRLVLGRFPAPAGRRIVASAMAARPARARRHLVHPPPVLLFLAALTFGWSGEAAAQAWRPWTIDFWRPFGVAVSVVHVQPTDGEVDPTTTVGFGAGFFPTAGWGAVFGLGWVDTHVRTGGVTIGRLRARPIMGGAGYTWLRGPVSVKGSVSAGFVFNHASINEDLLAQLSEPISIEVRNSAAVRFSATLEYAVVRKLALRGNLSYLVTRPTVVVETAGGTTTGRWNASNVTAAGGVVFYPLR